MGVGCIDVTDPGGDCVDVTGQGVDCLDCLTCKGAHICLWTRYHSFYQLNVRRMP